MPTLENVPIHIFEIDTSEPHEDGWSVMIKDRYTGKLLFEVDYSTYRCINKLFELGRNQKNRKDAQT